MVVDTGKKLGYLEGLADTAARLVSTDTPFFHLPPSTKPWGLRVHSREMQRKRAQAYTLLRFCVYLMSTCLYIAVDVTPGWKERDDEFCSFACAPPHRHPSSPPTHGTAAQEGGALLVPGACRRRRLCAGRADAPPQYQPRWMADIRLAMCVFAVVDSMLWSLASFSSTAALSTMRLAYLPYHVDAMAVLNVLLLGLSLRPYSDPDDAKTRSLWTPTCADGACAHSRHPLTPPKGTSTSGAVSRWWRLWPPARARAAATRPASITGS